MKILYRNGKMICFEKKKIRREFYPFPNHLFTHTHIFANNLSSLHTCIRLFYVCKCPVADPRRPSLCFSSRIEKKNKMRNMFSFFREQIQSSVPHVSSLQPYSCFVHWKKRNHSPSFVRPFRFDFSSNDDHRIPKNSFCHLCFDIFPSKNHRSL